MKNLITKFLKDESGQTSTEYILLVAVVAVLVFKFKSVAVTKLDELTNQTFNKGSAILEDIK